MTFDELKAFALGDDFGAARETDAGRFINQALGRLHRALRLPTADARAIVTTAAGTNVYALPVDFVSLTDDEAILFETDVLEPVDISDFDQIPVASGQPRYFALSENLILLYPNPDAAYELTMRYRATQTLTDPTDEPMLPEDQQMHLAWFARAKLYLLTDDPDMHGQILATLPRELQADNLSLNQQRVPRMRQVPGTWSRLPVGPRVHHPDGLW
jgi:hypothetical protein